MGCGHPARAGLEGAVALRRLGRVETLSGGALEQRGNRPFVSRTRKWGEVAGCGASTQLHWAILKVLLSMMWSGEENPRERLLLRQMLKVSEDGLLN